MSLALLAGLLVLPQHLSGKQRFVAFTTWVAHTLMHIHVLPHPVCCFEDLMAHRTLLIIPTHCRQGVGHSLSWCASSSRS